LIALAVCLPLSGFADDVALRSRPKPHRIVDQAYYAIETVRSMHSIEIAVGAYYRDQKQYPKASSMAELRPMIEPRYIRTTSLNDGWGTAFRYSSDGEHFRLESAGSDHVFQSAEQQTPGLYTSSREDAVYDEEGVLREWLIQ